MYVVIVEFTTQPVYFDAFLARVRQQAEDSLRLEIDCHLFDICVNPEQDNFVLLYEVYTDKDAFDTHLESKHFFDFNDAVQDWVIDKKVSVFQKVQVG